MNTESIHDFWKRKDHVNFTDIMRKEHSFVNCSSLPNESLPKKSRKRHRQSIIGNIGFDIFSANDIDGYNTRKKFMIVDNSASEVDCYNFWNTTWESDSRVIVRFDKSNSKRHHWLNDIQTFEYTVGEFAIRKKIITDKYYTQLKLTIRNRAVRKLRKITHYQYHDFPDRNMPFNSAQLICFLKMVNKAQYSYRRTTSDGKKSALGPIVIHSVGCFERAVSLCALDICLDQLKKTKSVSVPNALLKIKSQVPFKYFSLEEYTFINNTLLHCSWALDFEKKKPTDSNPDNVSFRSRVKKYCFAFKRASVF